MTMGVLLTAGGAYAYMKKGSKASLLAGCGVGGLFFISGALLQAGQNKNGHLLALASSAAVRLPSSSSLLLPFNPLAHNHFHHER
jgi:uncharacterized membrane protein (UPF0136 family)